MRTQKGNSYQLDCYTFADRMSEDFSREAALALFDWLEELEEAGEGQEFNPQC